VRGCACNVRACSSAPGCGSDKAWDGAVTWRPPLRFPQAPHAQPPSGACGPVQASTTRTTAGRIACGTARHPAVASTARSPTPAAPQHGNQRPAPRRWCGPAKLPRSAAAPLGRGCQQHDAGDLPSRRWLRRARGFPEKEALLTYVWGKMTTEAGSVKGVLMAVGVAKLEEETHG